MYKNYTQKSGMPPGYIHKILLAMRLTTMILIATIMQVSATGFAQKVTLAEKGASLKQVFKELRRQTHYDFVCTDDLFQSATTVDIKVNSEELKDVLDKIFAGQPLTYTIDEKTVVVQQKVPTFFEKLKAVFTNIDVAGRILDEHGQPIPGATVTEKGKANATNTDVNGYFRLTGVADNATIVISIIGFDKKELPAAANLGDIRLTVSNSKLDEIQVIGYGTTSKRLNTGSVSTLTAEEIEKQPVTDVLSALSGREAGVFVQTANGLPGGNINITIRGQNSLRTAAGNNGNLPLYVIDGVPFSADPLNSANSLSSTVNGAISPFNSLNPADIESISILKDADATAIYGSRGANGVVLITTKKGKPGTTKVNVNYAQGISKVADFPDVLTLQQYLTIRKEAFKNDGKIPSSDPTSANYAPDLTVWSQTQSTDWAKFLMGNTASTTDLQASVSGGNESTQFLMSVNYRSEGSVLLGGSNYQRAGLHFNIAHTSLNKKFNLQFTGSYSGDNNLQSNAYSSFSAEILTAPNFPLYDQSGNLNWSNNLNPLADIKAQSKTQTNNFVANALLSYTILPGLIFKTSAGYNRLGDNQVNTYPLSSQNPSYAVSTATYGDSYNQSIIIEPQISYTKTYKKSTINVLLGGTYQNSLKNGDVISASNFSNDALIQNASSASTVTVSNSFTDYKYESVFARLTDNFDQKYIVDASARRDGSSRFGPGDQFGNFGAIGGAWIFSNEAFIKDNFTFLSFGKLRGSYGITGNDQIKDYQFLSTYGSSGVVYQGVSALKALQIANADLQWETNKKAELGIELGLLNNRISLSIDRYQNRSGNQLIAYTLPYLTGFASYQANLPAVIQNSGWEFEINTLNIQSKDFNWKTTFNLTLPKNELLSFPGLAASSYANTLIIGHDISQGVGYSLTGIDPATGKAQYATLPGSASLNPYNKFGQTSPYFYGGLGNTFTYKNWQMDIFGQFTKQYGKGGITYNPGYGIHNSYTNVLARWQAPGDVTNVPGASTVFDSHYASSQANWFNASYFRLKNVAISYNLPSTWLKNKGIDRLRIYLEGQNIWTIWNKNAALYDPETSSNNPTGSIPIPPLRSLIAGIQITL